MEFETTNCSYNYKKHVHICLWDEAVEYFNWWHQRKYKSGAKKEKLKNMSLEKYRLDSIDKA